MTESKQAIVEAKKESLSKVSPQAEFDPLFTTELQSLQSIVKGMSNIYEAIKSRTDLIGLIYTEESKQHEIFAKAQGTVRKRLFSGVHSLSMDKFKKVHKKLVKAEIALEDVLKSI